ncbi:hypothetical protein MRX96_051595 [Rhipicephalus microplus]
MPGPPVIAMSGLSPQETLSVRICSHRADQAGHLNGYIDPAHSRPSPITDRATLPRRAAQRHTTRRLYQDSDDDVTRSGTPSPMTPAIFTDCKYMSNARAPTRLQQRVAGTARQRVECESSCYRRTGRRQSRPLPR